MKPDNVAVGRSENPVDPLSPSEGPVQVHAVFVAKLIGAALCNAI